MTRQKRATLGWPAVAGLVRSIAVLLAMVIVLAITLGMGSSPSVASVAKPGVQTATFSGTRDYVVLFKPVVELGPRLRGEVRKGAKVEDRFSSSVNGALLKLEDDDVNRLQEDGAILAIERDRRVSIGDSGDRLILPWGLDRINQRDLPLDGALPTRAGGEDVDAYIIDTGIALNHAEFRGRLNSAGFSAHGSRDDCNGHGTHVAGIVSGPTFGVAPGSRLTSVKVLDCEGSGWTSDVIAGIDWMISHHLSRGGYSAEVVESRTSMRNYATGRRFANEAAGEASHSAGSNHSVNLTNVDLLNRHRNYSPDNDDFDNSETLSLSGPTASSNVEATTEPGEPGHSQSRAYGSIWFRWTAPSSGTVTLDTSGSDFDTVLAAYTGSSVESLSLQASDDDSGDGMASVVVFPVLAGNSYSIAIDGFAGASGSVRLSGSLQPGGGDDPEPPVDPGPPAGPRKPAIANLSLGSSRSETTNAAIQRAVDAGIAVVVAAGNESDDACDYSPASAPNAITVGSTGSIDNKSGFSNVGDCVDMFAPGEEITSAFIGSPRAREVLSGTSMAAPHVAGAVARLLSMEPSLDPSQVSDRLLEGATAGAVKGLDQSTPNLLLHVPSSETRIEAPAGDILTDRTMNEAIIVLSGSRESTLQCSLNGAPWESCLPGVLRMKDLRLGSHTFELKGETDGIPIQERTFSWRYVPVAPSITEGPGRGTSRKAFFRLRIMSGLRSECRLDQGPWQPCSGKKRYSGLKPGRHTFQVKQSNGELVSPVASWNWKVLKSR